MRVDLSDLKILKSDMHRDLPSRRALLPALIAVSLGFAWQALTVRCIYGGNWTALYRAGAWFTIPPQLAAERVRVMPGPGYDGQMYHLAAHDPLLLRGFAGYMDLPRLRYRRILVPALAFLLAGGRRQAIDPAYVAVTLAFLFLGAWWLGRLLILAGRNPWWAVLFVLVPAAAVSLDRLTVDLSLAALAIGCALYAEIESDGRLYAALAAAALSRETALVLVAACCLFEAIRRRWLRAAAFATAALPALGWYLYVASRTPDIHVDLWPLIVPFRGMAAAVPTPAPFDSWIGAALKSLDLLSIAGVLLGAVLAFRRVPRTRMQIAVALWAAMALSFPYETWKDCCSIGRLLSPALLLLAFQSPARPAALSLLPLLLVAPRTWVQMVSPLLGIVRALARGVAGAG
jgi:hypothetical protein